MSALDDGGHCRCSAVRRGPLHRWQAPDHDDPAPRRV